MRKYERTAGNVTTGDTYAKLNEILIEAEELCAVMAHLHALQDNDADSLLAGGWRAMSQMMQLIRTKIMNLAMRKLY